ncbi:MAG TPA: methylmalonyl Co-A mutase-associated GTPase MeaB [Candidatus Baltobacteraceae bacterium]|nr:methylmalonyl Co-A mutase-associated GTPase MeaB [Candidatus Baltobacteraceae bacterium]
MTPALERAGLPVRVHRDLARAISAAENGNADLRRVAPGLAPSGTREGAAYVVGVTGPPGAGKSTLVDQLIERFRSRGDTVAVIAVDPSSPFTGGAVLGDRVRMQRHAGDTGVFIRSMASRESGGGLAPATHQAIALAERAGFSVVIVETVGVGQVELEVVGVADVVALLTVPALGDGVQTIKAGLTEIADLFVVNMADRPGANRTASDLRAMVRDSGRTIPVLQTIARDGNGIDEVMEALNALRDSHVSNAVRSLRFDVLRSVRDAAARRALAALGAPQALEILARLEARAATRAQAREQLLPLVLDEVIRAD